VDDGYVFIAAGGLMAIRKHGAGQAKKLEGAVGVESVRVQGDSIVIRTSDTPPRVLRAKKAALFAR
jgi:hypothetical protein